jgi:AraC family transcriptional regulator, regulatory protein of adaptative response / DNA-3-methyladenine glycosylase II
MGRMPLHQDAAYLALKARDARFDGRLFVGVTSTRIYCRPVCRVRTPLRKNCRFYANAASAEHAGFRPCLRCRPELAPGLSLVDSSQVLAHHAARMLDHAARAAEPVRLPELAARLGVTDRHLRRIFAQEHGVTPIDYLTTQRLLLAKQLLTDTRLPVTEVALSCGFASVRRFNAVFAERCRLSPSRLRRDAADPAQGPAEQGLTVRIGYRPPYDVDGTLRFIADRVLAGIESVDGLSVRRTLRLGDAAQSLHGWLAVRFEPTLNEVHLTLSSALVPRLGRVLEAVRHGFDLDADPAQIDPVLAALPVPPRPGIRVPASLDGFETAVRVILGQQVTVAAARTLTKRLVEHLGEPVQTPWPGLNRLFPSAAAVAEADPDAIGKLGIVRRRVTALQALARAVHAGHIRLHRGAPLQATLQALRELPGVGEWTVQLIAMRALAWPDAFPLTDIGLLNALGTRVLADVQRQAEAWRPWRAYAVMRLWQTLEPTR